MAVASTLAAFLILEPTLGADIGWPCSRVQGSKLAAEGTTDQDPVLRSDRAVHDARTRWTDRRQHVEALDGQMSSRPNVLVIVTDDQRRGTLSPMRETQRWMVAGGTSFANAFVTTPLCCPSRSSILTGLFAHNHGVHGNEDGVERIFDPGYTVERYLHDAGYRTALFGKFLNGWPLDVNLRHFDRFAYLPRVSQGGYRDGEWNVNGNVRTVSSYSTTFIRRQAIGFLAAADRHDHQPWFLYLATPAPHLPAISEAGYDRSRVSPFIANPATCERDRSDKPAFVQGTSVDLADIQDSRRRMLRTLMSVDDMVGAVFRTLMARHELGNTLAIYVSDNGYLWGEHGLTEKSLPYTHSIKVPMVLRWPGHFAAGATDHRLAANIDLAPTILQAAGIVPARPMDGRSLLEPSVRTRVLTEFWRIPGFYVPTWASIRTTTYQYIEYYREDGSVFDREYYDLVTDPWQLTNLLSGDAPDSARILRLHDRLVRDRGCTGNTCP